MKWIKGQGEPCDVFLDGVLMPNAFETNVDDPSKMNGYGKVWVDDPTSYNGYSVKQGQIEVKLKPVTTAAGSTSGYSTSSIPAKDFTFKKLTGNIAYPVASGMPSQGQLDSFDKLYYDDYNPCRDVKLDDYPIGLVERNKAIDLISQYDAELAHMMREIFKK